MKLPPKMNPCEGMCLCTHKEWFKLEQRIADHLEIFGEGEVCPDCDAYIEWDCSELVE